MWSYKGTELIGYHNQLRSCFDLWLVQRGEDGSKAVSTNVIMQTVGENEQLPQAPITLPEHGLQGLMDSLWRMGVRPSEYRNASTTVEAMERHLEDMRALAFHQIKAPKPELKR